MVTYQKTYGTINYDAGRAVPTRDSGLIYIGSIHVFQTFEAACLIKLNKYGDTVWTKKYKHPNYGTNANRHIIELSNGDYFFVLIVTGGPSPGAIGVRTNSVGDTLRTIVCPNSESFHETSDGGIVFFSPNTVSKYDSNLTLQWQNHFGGLTEYLDGNGIRTTDNGFFLFSSTRQYAAGGPSDFDWLGVKLDSIGNIQWEKVYGTTFFENIGTVQQTFDGGYIMVGTTYVNGGPSNSDVLVIKTDGNGVLQWTKTYGGPAEEEAACIRVTPGSPGYIISGLTLGNELSFAGRRGFVYKLDLSGNFQWGKIYGSMNTTSAARDEIHHAYQVYDGGYVMSGQTANFGQSGSFDFWIIKTNNLGASGCNEINTIPQVLIPTIFVTSITANDIPGIGTILQTFGVINSSLLLSTLCSSNIPTLIEHPSINEPTFSLYPNPSSGSLTLNHPNKFSECSFTIINSLSQIVHAGTLQDPDTFIHLQLSLENGIYFVVVSSKERTLTQKFMLYRD